jgi:hypothetical protein
VLVAYTGCRSKLVFVGCPTAWSEPARLLRLGLR